MAAPDDRQILLRRFEGVNLLVDSAYLGPAYLRRAQNWIPGETFRLETRPGSTPSSAGLVPGPPTRISAMIATKNNNQRLLFAVAVRPDIPADVLYVSINGAAWTEVGRFASVGQRYGMEAIGDVLYVSNPIDPLKLVQLDDLSDLDLDPIGAFTDTSALPTLTADPGGQILSGTYAYCWCVYDHEEEVWVERSQTREVTKVSTGDEAIIFPVPIGFTIPGGAARSTNLRLHLFIAPVNYPIEFAHDQTPHGDDGSSFVGPFTIRSLTADGPTVPLRGITRTGAIMRYHGARLYLSGSRDYPNEVWATSVLQPGREQAIYNAGVFFPHNARLPRFPEEVTGLGLAAVGERGDAAITSPLVVATLTRTYLFFGDILDDPSAHIELVSRRAGCLNAEAMVETPHGVFYPGLESVYCVPPGGNVPIDVGWPISPAIKAISRGGRAFCTAIYHKGFYKLAIVPKGSTTATEQWWLDLRRGIGSVPSWWGPHRGVAPSAWCTTPYDPAETDRGTMAIDDDTGTVETIHQRNRMVEHDGTVPLVSIIRTGELDDGKPFERKLFKRVRAIGFPEADTQLELSMKVDGENILEPDAAPLDPLIFDAPGGAIWDIAIWDVAEWGTTAYTEGESIVPEDRPRGRSAELQFTHRGRIAMALREIELWYHPVPRPPRSTPDNANS